MKKNYSLLILVVALVLFSCNNTSKNNSSEKGNEVVTVGALFPLTGDAASYGKEAQQGIELALSELGDSSRIKIIYEDSRAEPKTSVSGYNKLAKIDKLPVVISFVSGVILAIAPESNKDNVILFNTLAQNPNIDKAGEYTFSNVNSANIETYQLAEFIYNKGINEIAIVNADVSYGIGAKNAMEAKFVNLGGKVALNESFPEGNTNYRTIITKLKNNNIKNVYVPAIGKDVALFVRQAYELGYRPNWFSFTSFEGDDVIETGKQALEGLIYSSSAFGQDSLSQKFIKDFEEKYNNLPQLWAATNYDAIKILNNAILNGNKTADEIKSFLLNMPAYKGASGLTNFDEQGNVNKPVIFKTVINGKFIPIK